MGRLWRELAALGRPNTNTKDSCGSARGRFVRGSWQVVVCLSLLLSLSLFFFSPPPLFSSWYGGVISSHGIRRIREGASHLVGPALLSA